MVWSRHLCHLLRVSNPVTPVRSSAAPEPELGAGGASLTVVLIFGTSCLLVWDQFQPRSYSKSDSKPLNSPRLTLPAALTAYMRSNLRRCLCVCEAHRAHRSWRALASRAPVLSVLRSWFEFRFILTWLWFLTCLLFIFHIYLLKRLHHKQLLRWNTEDFNAY